MKVSELVLEELSNKNDVMNSKEYKSLVRQEKELIKRYKATSSDIKKTMLNNQISELSNKKAAMLRESASTCNDCEELELLISQGMSRREASEFLRGKGKTVGDGNGPYKDGNGPHGLRGTIGQRNIKNRLRQRFFSKIEESFLEDVFNEIQMINEEWYDAYRDFKGQGMSDTEARKEADKMYGNQDQNSYASKKQNIKPTLVYMRFYNVKKDDENRAKTIGLKKTKNGKWYIGVYDTSGIKTKDMIKTADDTFGSGKDWRPNNK